MIFVPGGPVSHLLFICILGLNHQTPGASPLSLDGARWAPRTGLQDQPQLKTTGPGSSTELCADPSSFAAVSVTEAVSECGCQS